MTLNLEVKVSKSFFETLAVDVSGFLAVGAKGGNEKLYFFTEKTYLVVRCYEEKK